MIEIGKVIPDGSVKDFQGRSYRLSDFRQKSHVILIYEPQASRQILERWTAAIGADQKQWAWLNATVLVAQEVTAELKPGVYVIDRYGTLLNYSVPGNWSFDALERELLYYEAAHC
jgi:hypothetical protein